MPMYNLLKYSQNYSMTSGSLWNYYRDEVAAVDDYASDGKSSEYKKKNSTKTARKTRKTWEDTDRPPQTAVPALNVEVTIPLKCLGNFWRFLDLPLIKREIEPDLS